MKPMLPSLALLFLISACNTNEPTAAEAAGDPTSAQKPVGNYITGTWQLLTGTLIEKGDTTVTDYTKKLSCIKIIDPTHFAFLQHDLDHGKDTAVFVAGGGRYTLKDSMYTEHLQYCNAREWEGHDFSFRMTVHGDTLIQEGVEKIEAQGIDRLNREVYVRAVN